MRLLKLLLILFVCTAAVSPTWAQPAFDDADAQLRVKQAAAAASAATRNVEALRKALETERQRVVATDGERDMNGATIKALEQELRSVEAMQRQQDVALRVVQDTRARGLAAESERRRLEEERQQAAQQSAPANQLRPPKAVDKVDPRSNERYEQAVRLEKGDTIDALLADLNVPEVDRKQIDEKLQQLLKKKKLAVGEQISLIIQSVPDQPAVARVLSFSVRPQPEREYLVLREDDGSYRGEEKVHKVSTRIVRVEGERQGSLHQSGVAAGAPSAAMVEFIRALSYDVDFQREFRDGQKFTVLLEQLVTSDGTVMHPGRLLAGELRLMDRTVTIVRFRPQGGADGFYTLQGENVVRSFLRTPMDISRITLGYSATHTGVDFAAEPGTPILAAGAGTVDFAGHKSGYGLYVRLIHTEDIATGYSQMSHLGPGIKLGVGLRSVVGSVHPTWNRTYLATGDKHNGARDCRQTQQLRMASAQTIRPWLSPHCAANANFRYLVAPTTSARGSLGQQLIAPQVRATVGSGLYRYRFFFIAARTSPQRRTAVASTVRRVNHAEIRAPARMQSARARQEVRASNGAHIPHPWAYR